MKSWPDLNEYEESKATNVYMMQPQDFFNPINESSEQVKPSKVTDAYKLLTLDQFQSA
jgi:hypothetical protein